MPILKVVSTEKFPIKIWTDDIEYEALEQIKNTGNLPFVFKWISIMPDCHAGSGAVIGSVVATKGAIVPSCVGVDIGCGVRAIRTNLKPEQLDGKLPQLREAIEKVVPVGFNQHNEGTLDWLSQAKQNTLCDGAKAIKKRANLEGHSDKILKGLERFTTQLGTLGGGNHFIEVCVSTKNEVWVMLHSGSRGTGNLLAQHHINVAKGLMKAMFIKLPDPDLSYLSEKTKEYDDYMNDLLWAQDFALFNREVMMSKIIVEMQKIFPAFAAHRAIDCHHNYVSKENHYGENVLITRKGAIRARHGDVGIIPGSMGNKSFIVSGLGNPESFDSASHGAGRRMSRTKARATFTVEDFNKQTEGVECKKDGSFLDEIPGAYKNIETVMSNQSDLVEILEELKQVLCVKG